jgi:hypothetical protein
MFLLDEFSTQRLPPFSLHDMTMPKFEGRGAHVRGNMFHGLNHFASAAPLVRCVFFPQYYTFGRTMPSLQLFDSRKALSFIEAPSSS